MFSGMDVIKAKNKAMESSLKTVTFSIPGKWLLQLAIVLNIIGALIIYRNRGGERVNLSAVLLVSI